MPRAPWLMTQSWHDLLFAHWRVDVSEMRRAVPAAFDLDLFDDEAWLGVVPFYMTNVGLRAAPALPWLSAFPELNVRTYVRVADRPGVYFFSLDAARWLAVAAARTLLNLPYYTADMTSSAGRLPCTTKCTPNATRAVQGHVRTCGRALRRARRFDRVFPHGAILPVSSRPPGPSLPPRDSPPAVVPAARTRDDHDEHDGRSQSSDAQRLAGAIALRTASRRGRMGADASVRPPSAERTERHRVAQLGDGRDVMFVRSPRLLRHEVRRTPREHDLVCRRSTRRRRAGDAENGTDGTSSGMPTRARCRRRCRIAVRRDASRWACRDDTR